MAKHNFSTPILKFMIFYFYFHGQIISYQKCKHRFRNDSCKEDLFFTFLNYKIPF